MKKTISYISIVLASAIAILCSCTKNPWNAIAAGDWNQERTIIEIKFEGQAGTPVITNTSDTEGEIELGLAPAYIADMSKVKIEILTLSYKAVGSVSTGGTIDFTQDDPTISVTSQTGKTRVYTLHMTEFEETLIGCYKIATSQVFGGTGAVYGGSAVMEPSTKSWCWAERDGHGPTAEYDDYIEITLDEILPNGNTTGKCVHYGGIDKKHWNGIFDKSMNKEGTTDIDLRKFYRQIPIGTSKWTRNYSDGTVTFKDANGKETVGTLMPPGTHEIYNYGGTVKTVTLTDNSFAFTLKGVDDWTNIYSDYDKFVKKPMAYFITVNKVSSIPAESKTEGSEGDTSIVEPEPEPEVTSIAGTYKVSSLKVLGGTGNDPAFLSPVDKSWVWNSSIYNESDNILVLTATGTDSHGCEVGTCHYQPGNDGKYWDYMYLASKSQGYSTTDIDCSDYYGLLPHSVCNYVFDKGEGKVTFSSGSSKVLTVNFMTAGSYKFKGAEYEKDLTVTGDIAFDFILTPFMTSASPYRWTDFDRFVVGPRNYVMEFKLLDE